MLTREARIRLFSLVCSFLVLLWLAGCGGASSNSTPGNPSLTTSSGSGSGSSGSGSGSGTAGMGGTGSTGGMGGSGSGGSGSGTGGSSGGSGGTGSGGSGGGGTGSGPSSPSATGQFVFAGLANVPSGSPQFQDAAEYAVNSNGSLSTVSTTVNTGNDATLPFRDPTHKFLYIVGSPKNNSNYNIISAFSVDGSGNLTPISGSPFNFNQQELARMAFRPDGKFVYVTDFQDPTIVHIISVDPTSGKLVQEVSTTTIPSGNAATVLLEMQFDSSGKFLYFSNAERNTIDAYSSDPASGSLTQVPGAPFTPHTATTGGCSPKGQVCGSGLASSGNYLYYASVFFNGIAAFSIDPTTGALMELSGSPFADPAQTGYRATTTPNGSFLYVVNADGTLAGYTVNKTTGALTNVSGMPKPSAIGDPIADDTSQFLYIDGMLDGYQINQTTGALTTLPGSPYDKLGSTGVTIVH